MLTVITVEGLRTENDIELFWQMIEKLRIQFDIDKAIATKEAKDKDISYLRQTLLQLRLITSVTDVYRLVFFECFDLAVMSIRYIFDYKGFKIFSNKTCKE